MNGLIAEASAVNLSARSSLLINRPSSPSNNGSEPNSQARKNIHRLSLSLSESERAPLLLSSGALLSHDLLSVSVDRPSTPGIAQRSYLAHQITSTEQQYTEPILPTPGGSPAFTFQPRGGTIPAPTLRSRVKLFINQLITNAISTFFLALIVLWALTARSVQALLDYRRWSSHDKRPWDNAEKYKHEILTKDVKYYAENCGYKIEDQTVETEDGYYLRVHKVSAPHKDTTQADGRGGYPVIIQHGLFQTSGSFVTSEERSLAFWLAEQGYQVYLSNSRAVFDMGHRVLDRSDPRFWGLPLSLLTVMRDSSLGITIAPTIVQVHQDAKKYRNARQSPGGRL